MYGLFSTLSPPSGLTKCGLKIPHLVNPKGGDLLDGHLVWKMKERLVLTWQIMVLVKNWS